MNATRMPRSSAIPSCRWGIGTVRACCSRWSASSRPISCSAKTCGRCASMTALQRLDLGGKCSLRRGPIRIADAEEVLDVPRHHSKRRHAAQPSLSADSRIKCSLRRDRSPPHCEQDAGRKSDLPSAGRSHRTDRLQALERAPGAGRLDRADSRPRSVAERPADSTRVSACQQTPVAPCLITSCQWRRIGLLSPSCPAEDHRCPTLGRLDKLGVTGSSQYRPLGKAPETGPFCFPSTQRLAGHVRKMSAAVAKIASSVGCSDNRTAPVWSAVWMLARRRIRSRLDSHHEDRLTGPHGSGHKQVRRARPDGRCLLQCLPHLRHDEHRQPWSSRLRERRRVRHAPLSAPDLLAPALVSRVRVRRSPAARSRPSSSSPSSPAWRPPASPRSTSPGRCGTER